MTVRFWSLLGACRAARYGGTCRLTNFLPLTLTARPCQLSCAHVGNRGLLRASAGLSKSRHLGHSLGLPRHDAPLPPRRERLGGRRRERKSHQRGLCLPARCIGSGCVRPAEIASIGRAAVDVSFIACAASAAGLEWSDPARGAVDALVSTDVGESGGVGDRGGRHQHHLHYHLHRSSH